VLAIVTIFMAGSGVAQEETRPRQNSETVPSAVPAPADTRIPRNSRVYIEYMDGFETYLAAAIRKKEVPIVMVTDPALADFIISGNHETNNDPAFFTGDLHPTASATMQVVNVKTRVIIYADSSHRLIASRGERSTAEKLAKYLKKKIVDDEKKK